MATFCTVLRVGTGVLLSLWGVVGLVLPIVSGVPLLVAGLFMIGLNRRVLRPLTARMRRCGILRSSESDQWR